VYACCSRIGEHVTGPEISEDVANGIRWQKYHEARNAEFEAELPRRKMTNTRVFVSYSHDDVASVPKVLDVLQRSGVGIFIDEKDMEFGDVLAERIKSGLAKCTHYLLLLSATSAESQWCVYEYAVAETSDLELLVVKLDDQIAVPSFAASRLATSDLDALEKRIARDRLDPGAVERFVTGSNRGLNIGREEAARLTDHRRTSGVESWDLPDEAPTAAWRRGLTGCWIAGSGRATVGLIYRGSHVWSLEYEDAVQAVEIRVLDSHSRAQAPAERLRTDEVADCPVEAWRPAVRWYSTFKQWDELHDFSAQLLARNAAGESDRAVNDLPERSVPAKLAGWEMSEDFWSAAVDYLRGLLPTEKATNTP